MVLHALIISESEVSIMVLCLLCSPHYTAVKIKNCLKSTPVIKVVAVKITMVPRPSFHLKLKYPLPFSISLFNSLHSSANQELFEKYLCNQGSHYKKSVYMNNT